MGQYLDIPNLDVLIAQLGKLEDVIGELAEPTEETLKLLKERMQEYPPERPGQKYVRTDTLKNGWSEHIILSGDRLGVLRNPTSYGRFVQSDIDQAWMHKDRWQTDKQVVDEKENEVVRIYERYLQKRLNEIK
jgi:hypothetical protein